MERTAIKPNGVNRTCKLEPNFAGTDTAPLFGSVPFLSFPTVDRAFSPRYTIPRFRSPALTHTRAGTGNTPTSRGAKITEAQLSRPEKAINFAATQCRVFDPCLSSPRSNPNRRQLPPKTYAKWSLLSYFRCRRFPSMLVGRISLLYGQ